MREEETSMEECYEGVTSEILRSLNAHVMLTTLYLAGDLF